MRPLLFTALMAAATTACVPPSKRITHVEANDKGNGGVVVTCPVGGSAREHVQLLDFYEAKVLRDIPYDFGGTPGGIAGRLQVILARLERVDPRRAAHYREQADHFFEDVRFVKGLLLPDTNDYGWVPIPAGCRFEQLAVQRPPSFPEDRRYLLSQDLWERLDDDHRAGLVLHEIVYREAIGKGQKDSVNARYFTSMLASRRLERFDAPEYTKLLGLVALDDSGGNRAPQWVLNPIQLTVCLDRSVQADLGAYVRDPDGDVLTFGIEANAPWLSIGPTGTLGGIPPELGTVRVSARASDGKDTGYTTVVIQVADCQAQQPVALVARENTPFTASLRPFFPGAAGTVTKESGPEWLQVSASGDLFGTPRRADVGEGFFVFSIAIHEREPIRLPVKMHVVLAEVPPVWSHSVIQGEGRAGDTFWLELAAYVFSPDGSPIVFSMLTGPDWLTMSPGGVLMGQPTARNVGTYCFTVQAANRLSSTKGICVRIDP